MATEPKTPTSRKKKAAAAEQAPVHYIQYSEINIGERVRDKPGKLNELADDLEQNGQINPITYEVRDGVKYINTGFRRWAATGLLASKTRAIGGKLPEGHARRLPVGVIMARDMGEMSEIEKLRIELAENEARKEFTDAERAIGFSRLKKLMEAELGRTVRVSELAEELKVSVGQVGMGLQVADAVENKGRKDLLTRPSIKAAYQELKTSERLEQLKNRAAKNAVASTLTFDIEHADGLQWLQTLPSESVDFVNFDPPWGIDVQQHMRETNLTRFDDNASIWKSFIEPSIPEIYRVLKNDTWSVVWFGIQFYERLSTLLRKAGFMVEPVPCVWYKDNKTGSQNDPARVLLNVWEPFFIIRKGEPRMFKTAQNNVLVFPMDRFDEREHYAQKPAPLMAEILHRYTTLSTPRTAADASSTLLASSVARSQAPNSTKTIGARLSPCYAIWTDETH
jgi:hypothetical protein